MREPLPLTKKECRDVLRNVSTFFFLPDIVKLVDIFQLLATTDALTFAKACRSASVRSLSICS